MWYPDTIPSPLVFFQMRDPSTWAELVQDGLAPDEMERSDPKPFVSFDDGLAALEEALGDRIEDESGHLLRYNVADIITMPGLEAWRSYERRARDAVAAFIASGRQIFEIQPRPTPVRTARNIRQVPYRSFAIGLGRPMPLGQTSIAHVVFHRNSDADFIVAMPIEIEWPTPHHGFAHRLGEPVQDEQQRAIVERAEAILDELARIPETHPVERREDGVAAEPGAREPQQGWVTTRYRSIRSANAARTNPGVTHAPPCAHKRRGHWRRQRHGHGRLLLRWIWVDDIEVGGRPSRSIRTYADERDKS